MLLHHQQFEEEEEEEKKWNTSENKLILPTNIISIK